MGNNALILGVDPLVGRIMDDVQEEKERRRAPSQDEKVRDAISEVLKRLGGLNVQEDALIFEGEKFIFPRQYEGRIDSVIDFLRNHIKQQEQPFDFSRTMPFRPYDGAHAFMNVMKQITGTTGLGVTKMTFFGPRHPEFRTINTSPTTTTQVPWGTVAFPSYKAEFEVGYNHDPERGLVFHLSVNAPRRYRREIEAIFFLVEKELKENSIYRGQALNGAEMPDFLNLDGTDPDKVVYSQDVITQLSANVWAPIRYANEMRTHMPLKRAILFAGPYGTGKSLGGVLTAQVAVQHGWTALICRPGKDNPAEVLKTAELYAPAVVVIEDVDTYTSGGSNLEISAMLDMLDGITNKGVEVIALFTTNHLERIQKGALRPGRIDAVIKIHGLDKQAFQRLIEVTLGKDHLADDIDWDEVNVAFKEFLPAFVVEAARRSQRFAFDRNQGVPGIMTTKDLVAAAESLAPQNELMKEAKEGANRATIADGLREVFEDVQKRTKMNGLHVPFEVQKATVMNGGTEKG